MLHCCLFGCQQTVYGFVMCVTARRTAYRGNGARDHVLLKSLLMLQG